MRERLTFAVYYEVVGVHHLCKWLISVSEYADPILKQRQSLILLHEAQVDLLLELRKGIKFLHRTIFEIGWFVGKHTLLVEN